MVQVEVMTDGYRRIVEYRADGHAANRSRSDSAVCAAVSTLSRTAAATLRKLPDVDLNGKASRPGDFRFSVSYPSGEADGQARGVSETILTGLQQLANEHPDLIKLLVRSE